jgi:hypothetical protein
MRITTNPYLFLIIIAVSIAPCSALFNVTPSTIGDTAITWQWDSTNETTDIYVDGYKMCGYETTIPVFDATGLTSCYLHNITVFTATDNGTNYTSTTCPTTSTIFESGDSGGGAAWLAMGLMGGILGFIIYSRRKKDEADT